jgi:tetratricopeptide (TPR) repeat protein
LNALAHKHCPLVLATLISLGFARSALAAEGRGSEADGISTVAQLNEEGADFYAKRDYRHAIERFIQAYAVDGDPNLLYNLARCYEELGEPAAAIEKYEAFLAAPGADAAGRQRARQSLEALRKSQRAQKRAQTMEPQPSSDEQPVGSVALQPQDDGTGQTRVLPWLTLGGGVALAAVGTTFYALGVGDHGQVEDADGYGDPNVVSSMTRREAEELVSSGDTKKLVGGISLGIGGALLATYVVMLASGGGSEPAPSAPVAFSLSPDGSGGSLSLQGSF